MQHLVLFDIDGTILHSGSAGRDAMEYALATIFGTPGDPSMRYDGKTDKQIVRESMLAAGISEADIAAAADGAVQRQRIARIVDAAVIARDMDGIADRKTIHHRLRDAAVERQRAGTERLIVTHADLAVAHHKATRPGPCRQQSEETRSDLHQRSRPLDQAVEGRRRIVAAGGQHTAAELHRTTTDQTADGLIKIIEIERRAVARWGGRVLDARPYLVGNALLYRLTLISSQGVARRVLVDARNGNPIGPN